MKMKPINLRFSGIDSGLESHFLRDFYSGSPGFLRYSMAAGIIVFLFLGFITHGIYSEGQELMNVAVFSAIAFSYMILFFSTYLKGFLKLSQFLSGAVFLLAGLVLASARLWGAPEDIPLYNTGLILVLILGLLFMRLRFINSAITALAVISLYFIIGFNTIYDISALTFALISAVTVFGITAAYYTEFSARVSYYRAHDLEVKNNKLSESNKKLEEKVRERTRALESTNENLKLEIVGRKFMEGEILNLNSDLEKRVISRTAQLEKALNELKEEIKVRKETEIMLLNAKNELAKSLKHQKKLNELKSRFIGSVSHEYRTPLTVILSSTYLLDIYFEKQIKSEFEEQINKIRTSVKDMTGLLDKVLTFEENVTENIGNGTESYDIMRLIKEETEKNGIAKKTPVFEIEPAEKEIYVRLDRKMTEQIVSNIITNAVKFSGNEPKINIKVEKKEKALSINIIDNGIGIPEEDLPHIFEPFHRAANVGANPGTGLGLSIVKRCVDKFRGTVIISSKINEFTNVAVIIPLN